MSHSKLDDITSAIAGEASNAPLPPNGPADTLAALRAPLQKRPVRTLPLWVGAATVAGIALVFTALPRSSEASKLLSLLEKGHLGIVHEVHYNLSTGQPVKELECFKDGRVAKCIIPGGGETLIEPGRATVRDPQGYIWSEQRHVSSAFASGPDLVTFLKNDPKAKVTRSGSTYTVNGALTDGQGVFRRYAASMSLDEQNRPVQEVIEYQGLGKYRIEFGYDGKQSDLQLAPVAKDRVYDLTAQRSELEAKIKSLKPGETGVIKAYSDENGNTGVLLAVPQVVSLKDELVHVSGASMEPVSLSFNGYDSARSDAEALRTQLLAAQTALVRSGNGVSGASKVVRQRELELQVLALQQQLNSRRTEIEVPVQYGKHRLFLKTLKTPKNLKTPFTLQFPFWKYDAAFKSEHPFMDVKDQTQPMLIGTNTYVVPTVEKTSSLTFLLCPLNVPFFKDSEGASGGATAATGN